MIVVAGLGNELLRDDGVGVHAVRQLARRELPDGVIVREVGTAVLDALPDLDGAAIVVALDAMQAGDAPGTIYQLTPGAQPTRRLEPDAHELNLQAALRLIPDGRRPEVHWFGVEPAVIDYGLELSPVVRAALPRLVEIVADYVTGLGRWSEGKGVKS